MCAGRAWAAHRCPSRCAQPAAGRGPTASSRPAPRPRRGPPQHLGPSTAPQPEPAAIDALKTHPNVNASYNEETKEITYYDAEHLGFAEQYNAAMQLVA